MIDVEIKICKDCKHYNTSKNSYLPVSFQLCNRPKGDISLITGKRPNPRCTDERKDKYTGILWWKKKVDTCGTEGKYFERKA